MIVVRQYLAGDKEGVLFVIQSVLYVEYKFIPDDALDDDLNEIEEYYSEPDGIFLVACDNGRIVGTAALRKLFDHDCEIKRMFVLPSHRRMGIGNLFMDRLIKHAREQGYHNMYLDSIEAMVAAHDLYRKYGFVEIPPYIPNPRAETYMVKRLSIDPSLLVLDHDASSIRERLLPVESKERLTLDDPEFSHAAVLFLLVYHPDSSYDLMLMKRTKRLSDRHSGEISFPGGKRDPTDENLIATALRECHEEIGIPPEKIQVLGSFDDYSTPAYFIITPVVGMIDEHVPIVKNDAEVEEVFTVPIDFFVDPRNYTDTTYELNGEVISIGRFVYHDPHGIKRIIWGATAHLIATFIRFVYDLFLITPGTRRAKPADFKQLYRKPMRKGKE